MGMPFDGVRPTAVALSDPMAADPAIGGGKAAAIARAAALGLPVLPGFILTTADGDIQAPEVRTLWAGLSHGGEVPLIVRSSSTIEDEAVSSMAGRFRSVLGVEGWDAFVRAVADVRASARMDDGSVPAPMAVLVQPFRAASCGGVMFGIDPVTGDRRRLVVEVVEGGPDALVTGGPCSAGGTSCNWHGSRAAPRRVSAARRTSSGRSTTQLTSSCSRAVP
jgi:pyruvate,water dikinase